MARWLFLQCLLPLLFVLCPVWLRAESVAETALIKQKAWQYYYGQGETQDYRRALQLYARAARQGDAEAQHIAGGMYFRGMGTGVDYPRAFQLLYQAASQGKSSPQSLRIIGRAFLLGEGTPKSIPDAVAWYNQAAATGDRDALNELGFLYFIGNGVEQDSSQAFALFSQAAKAGLAIAQYNLGILYLTGNGPPQTDLPLSYAWFNCAAASGHEQALSARAYLESLLAPAELEQAQQLSQQMYRRLPKIPSSRR